MHTLCNDCWSYQEPIHSVRSMKQPITREERRDSNCHLEVGTTKQQHLHMHYWHMWEYISDHEQVTAEMNTDQTFEHLLVNGCFNNLAIVSSGHDCVSACFEDTVMRISQQKEVVKV